MLGGMTARSHPAAPGPSLLDALSLLSEAADELVVRTARDTHYAWADRVHALIRGPRATGSTVPQLLHRGIAGAVYGGISLGLQAASKGLDAVATRGIGPGLEDDARGRFVSSAVNGLIGDRLARERPRLAIPMAVRARGHDVPLDADGLAGAFPDATGRVVLFLHGLCENDESWGRGRTTLGTTYGEMLAGEGWTPVFLRANSGLPLRENGVALSALVQRLTEEWPVDVTRIALVGHSMGGLVLRASGAVASEAERPWAALVSDVVTLGTPHLGAPLARGVGHGSRGLARLPETSAFGRILDWRSVGVHDLVEGLTDDVPALPHARYHLVAATVTTSDRHPVGYAVGDLLVRVPSAYGRDRYGAELFPGADVLHVGRAGHFGLLNHLEVHRAMREWLA